MTTLQEALDKCERVAIESGAHESYKAVGEAFSELRAALAQQGEPVAYMDNDGNISDNNDHGTFNTPLYTAPAPAPQAQPTDLANSAPAVPSYDSNRG